VAGCCECGDEPSGSCATELEDFCMTKYFVRDTTNWVLRIRDTRNAYIIFINKPVVKCSIGQLTDDINSSKLIGRYMYHVL
jgi:hypothetical protein